MMIQSKDDINYKRIGAHIKQLRLARKESQKAVAADLNMKYTSYSNYERGAERLPLWRIAQLCERYNVSLGSVLNDCSPVFLLECDTTETTDNNDYRLALNQLLQEACHLSIDQLNLFLALIKEFNEGGKKSRQHL